MAESALRESFAALRESSVALQRAFSALRRSSHVLHERSGVLQRSFAALRNPSRVLREPYPVLRESLRALQKPCPALHEPLPALQEAALVLLGGTIEEQVTKRASGYESLLPSPVREQDSLAAWAVRTASLFPNLPLPVAPRLRDYDLVGQDLADDHSRIADIFELDGPHEAIGRARGRRK